jgi:hypothetical protein
MGGLATARLREVGAAVDFLGIFGGSILGRLYRNKTSIRASALQLSLSRN